MKLPLSFRGPVTLRLGVHTRLLLSPLARARLATFADVGGVRRCFVGDYDAETYGEWMFCIHIARAHGLTLLNEGDGEWLGPEVDITCRKGASFVQIGFVDEPKEPGLFSRMFGRKH